MQSDLRGFNAPLFEARENLWSEMQACGGRGHGPAFAGVDRLVAFAVAAAVFARDIRRQGHVTQSLDDREEIRRGIKTDAALAEFSPRDDFSGEPGLLKSARLRNLTAEIHPLADANLFPRTHQAFPLVRVLRHL